MNQLRQTHPTPQQLTAYGQGRLDDAEHEAIEKHLLGCDSCCDAMKSLPDDTMVALLRGSADDTSVDGNVGIGPDSASPARPPSPPERRPDWDRPTLTGMETAEPFDDVTAADARRRPDASGDLPEELREHSRYRIVELLGRGGMGDVYRAEHRLMQRIVAVKVINSELVRNPAAVERFRREVQAAAKLAHPNIVTAFDAEQVGDRHILVMEYVDGIDLAEKVKSEGPLSVAEACEYARQAALGLGCAHEAGLVHRDIKPQNLMLQRRESGIPERESDGPNRRSGSAPATPDPGLVKILDFGLASLASEPAVDVESPELEAVRAAGDGQLTMVGTTMGTPDYVAPEQVRDAHKADIRADIYSLGCTLHYLLTGSAPFAGGTLVEKLMAHVEQPVSPLENFRDDVPDGLNAVLQNMLAKDPADRYQTPAEVAEALRPFTQTQSAAETSAPDTADHASRGALRGTARSGPASATAESARSRVTWLPWTAAALLAALLAAGIVFYVKLGETTLRFEVTDPNVTVRFGDEAITVGDSRTNTEFTVTPGDEQKFTILQNGTEVETDTLVLRRGQDVTLRIAVVDGDVEIRPSDLNVQVQRHLAGLLATLRGHTHWAWFVAASPDGKLLASASQDRSIRLWDARSHKLLATLHGHTAPVYAVAFSPDGRMLASAGGDKSVKLWDVASRNELATLTGHRSPVRTVAFSPDGKLLASGGGDKTVRLWDIEKRSAAGELTGHTAMIYCVGFSPDGRILASAGNDKTIRLWNVEQQTERMEITGHGSEVYCVAFSPDGRTLASGGMNRAIRLWDTATGRLKSTISGHTARVFRLEFSPDGRTLASASWDHTIGLWDVGTNKRLTTLKGHTEHVKCVTFLPEGKTLASAAGDNTVRLWKVPESAWPSGTTPADTQADTQAGQEPAGWEPLFNRKDLTGWKTHPTQQPGGWKVENGVLVGSGGSAGHLFTERDDFEDFHLQAEVKINETGNSGIYFRCPFGLRGGGGRYPQPIGYEAQILNGKFFYARGKLETQMTGSLFQFAPYKERLVPPDEWFTLEVIAEGNHIVIQVDGKTTADFTDPKHSYSKGHIVLQQFSPLPEQPATEVQFRKIEVRNLR